MTTRATQFQAHLHGTNMFAEASNFYADALEGVSREAVGIGVSFKEEHATDELVKQDFVREAVFEHACKVRSRRAKSRQFQPSVLMVDALESDQQTLSFLFSLLLRDEVDTRALGALVGLQENPRSSKAVLSPKARPLDRFRPTSTLVEYWRRGLQDHVVQIPAGEVASKAKAFLDKHSTADFIEAFAKRFMRMLSVLGNRQRFGIEDFSNFAIGGRFSLRIQYEILDRIQVSPDENTDFFRRLFDELHQHLAGGGTVAGAWGELVAQGASIKMVTTPPEDVEVGEPWEVAKKIA